MPPEQHLWGQASPLHVDAVVQIVRCHGRTGGSSSLHLHRHKSNTFLVRKGRMRIDVGETEIVLGTGDSFTVRPGLRHRMTFLQDTDLIELYTALPGQAVDPADIVRFDEGQSPG
jgi:mannose-6-phosphate isomerase-like protein (cupin superfamily)